MPTAAHKRTSSQRSLCQQTEPPPPYPSKWRAFPTSTAWFTVLRRTPSFQFPRQTHQQQNNNMIRQRNAINGNRVPISTTPPKHLNKVASSVWRETLKSVSAAGYQIDDLDAQAFHAFCSAAATIRECDTLLDKDGLCVDGGREGLKRHPAASVKNSALTQLRSYAAALGLTASSRARLPEEFQPEEVNEFAED